MPEQTKQSKSCTLPIWSIHMWTTGHLVKTSVRHLKQILISKHLVSSGLRKEILCQKFHRAWLQYISGHITCKVGFLFKHEWKMGIFCIKKINSLDILVRRNHNCQNKTPLQLQWPITGMLLKILFLHLGQKNFGWKTFHVNSSSCRGACL